MTDIALLANFETKTTLALLGFRKMV
jgi:hypothetical protein